MDTITVKDGAGAEKEMLVSGTGASSSAPFSSIQKPFLQAVAEGEIDGYSVVEKFGENPDIDTGTDPEDIWSQGGLYTFSTSADIDSVSSSSASDTNEITIQGLDTDWNLVTQTATLTGQTRVALTTPLIRCFRAWNSNSTDWVGDVYIYVNTTLSAGVPVDVTKIRAEISIGAGQTEMCIYTIPAGKTGYFLGGYAAMSRVGNNSAVFTSKIRVFGGVFRTVSRISCIGAGASSWQYRYPAGQSLPEKTDILLRCEEVDANGTGVSGGFTILLKDN
jgi:hypothetical protein